MINSYYQQTLSCALCTTFLFLGSDLAAYHNEGSMRPIHVKTRRALWSTAGPGRWWPPGRLSPGAWSSRQ